jgi:DNA polymerase sigma
MSYFQQAGEFPTLRPLVLVLKCVLGQAGLNDASKGGLSSFALANMALASLQEDLKVMHWLSGQEPP